jgi:formyltetrahydrofolate deformylase
MKNYCLTVTCVSVRGIVAAISTYLAENGCNITASNQFDDADTDQFFARLSFVSEQDVALEQLQLDFAPIAAEHGMTFAFHDIATKMKVVIMVSRFGHCLNDLLYHARIGALPNEVVAVISNHLDYQRQVVNTDIGSMLGRPPDILTHQRDD